MDNKPSRPKTALYFILVFLIVFLIFLPSLHNDFINWDDPEYLLNNPHVRTLTLANIRNIFTTTVLGSYHPLTTLSFALQYHFIKLNPYFYHLWNLILHAINAVVVLWLIYLLSGHWRIALLGALLFGIHPLRVESVAWVTERKDVLFSFFYLLSLVFHVYFVSRYPSKKFYFLTLMFFILSLFSKSMAVTMPILLLIIDYHLKRKPCLKLITEKMPFFILSLIFGFIALWAQKVHAVFHKIWMFNFFERILITTYGLISYLVKWVAPVNLCGLYPHPEKINGLLPWPFYSSLFLIPALIYIILITLKFTRVIVFGFLFFISTIFLVLPVISLGHAMMSDRFSYIPSLGLSLILAQGMNYLIEPRIDFLRRLKPLLLSLILGYFVYLSFLSWNYSRVWQNSNSFWSHVLAHFPQETMAYKLRGNYFLERKEYQKAFVDYNTALRLQPNYKEAYNNRGVIYLQAGQYDLALRDFNQTLHIDPNYYQAYLNRGWLYFRRSEYAQALADCGKTLSLKPHNEKAHLCRAQIYIKKKQYNLAIDDFNAILALNPYHAKSYYLRGWAKYLQGYGQEALSDFQEAHLLSPQDNSFVAYHLLSGAQVSSENLSR